MFLLGLILYFYQDDDATRTDVLSFPRKVSREKLMGPCYAIFHMLRSLIIA